MKTIKDAHEALKGDLKNSHLYNCDDDKYLTYDNNDYCYVCLNHNEESRYKAYNRQYICTVEEFNNYKESNMIKFDKERALKGDKVIRRSKLEVKQLTVFKTDQGDIITGVVDGFFESDLHEGDLFMAPKQLSGFVNVWSNCANTYHASFENANQYAENMPKMNRIGLVDLSQFPEGHGL